MEQQTCNSEGPVPSRRRLIASAGALGIGSLALPSAARASSTTGSGDGGLPVINVTGTTPDTTTISGATILDFTTPTAPGSFHSFEVVTEGLAAMVVLIGGGGGGSGGPVGSGGGGGAVYYASDYLLPGSYQITVGTGGAGGGLYESGQSGTSSELVGPDLVPIFAGGGAGSVVPASYNETDYDINQLPPGGDAGASTFGLGYAGSSACDPRGAGGSGTGGPGTSTCSLPESVGDGGDGIFLEFGGGALVVSGGGGGGGGCRTDPGRGAGAVGFGGGGGGDYFTPAVAGAPNTGGGGGGGGNSLGDGVSGAAGGSGRVVVLVAVAPG